MNEYCACFIYLGAISRIKIMQSNLRTSWRPGHIMILINYLPWQPSLHVTNQRLLQITMQFLYGLENEDAIFSLICWPFGPTDMNLVMICG